VCCLLDRKCTSVFEVLCSIRVLQGLDYGLGFHQYFTQVSDEVKSKNKVIVLTQVMH
jgi:hypothetical protein